MRYWIIIAILLSGCGVEDDKSRKPPEAIKGAAEYTDNFALNHTLHYPIGQLVEDLWLTAKMCSGIDIDPAYKVQIDYVTDRFVIEDSNATGAIWVEANYARIWQGDIATFTGQVTVHEFIHYLLYLNGQDHLNDTHNSPLFEQCAPGTTAGKHNHETHN